MHHILPFDWIYHDNGILWSDLQFGVCMTWASLDEDGGSDFVLSCHFIKGKGKFSLVIEREIGE